MHQINLRNLFLFLLLAFAFASSVWSANGSSCLPKGFDSFGSIRPNVINLKSSISADEVLSTQTANDPLSFICITDPAAELGFLFLPNSLFVDSQPGYFNADVNPLTDTPTRIRVGYSLRTINGDAFTTPGSPYSLYINYYVTIFCAGGGLSFVRKSNNEFRVRGINSAECNGNYSVLYKYEIFQNSESNLKTNYVSETAGNGFRLRTSLFRNSTATSPVNTLVSAIASSNSTVFQTNLSCRYSVSPSSVALGTFSSTDIFSGNVSSKKFSINALGCTNTSGGGRNHRIFVTFNFDAVDPADPTILTNNLSGANAAVNVGLSIGCTFNGVELAVQNNNLNLMTGRASPSNSIPCSVFMIPTPNVTNPNQIRPGSFNASATLTFVIN